MNCGVAGGVPIVRQLEYCHAQEGSKGIFGKVTGAVDFFEVTPG